MKKKFCFVFILIFLLTIRSANALDITAASGHWADIQAAVDQVVAAGGGDVHIPAGDWNVVNVGEAWTGFLINVPTSVSVFGATTERDADDQVVEWETRLIIPWAASPESGSHGPFIFGFHGSEFGDDFTRISDIEFIGYYNPDHDWLTRRTYMIAAIGLDYVNEYRVDHVRTEHMRYGGVKIWGREARGVIDHCSFENPVWYSQGASMSDMDIGYGVSSSRIGYNFQSAREGLLEYWDSDDQDVLGKYTRYSNYIEDCYFTTWRHALASNWGAHYVVRHSTFEDEYVFGTVDAHGWGFYGCYAPDGYWCYNRGPYDTYMAENYPGWTQEEIDDYWEENKVVGWLGTRAFEVYNNTFEGTDPERSHGSVVFARGGASAHFNNDVGLNSDGINRYFEAGNEGTWEESWNRIWIWGNNLGPSISLNAPTSNPDIPVVESRPAWYTPYTYPHPLTIDSSSKHRIWGTLLDLNNLPMQSQISVYIEDTDTLITSGQTDTSGSYDLQVQPGVFDIAYRILDTGFYIPNFYLRLRSINVSAPLQNMLGSITSYTADRKIGFILNVSESQRIRTYSHMKPARVRMNDTLLSEAPSLSALTDNTWYYDSAGQMLHMIVSPLVVVTAASGTVHNIQTAVDQVVAAGGGTVQIPAGTFTFNASGDYRVDVDVPAGGINILGAGIDQTVLQMPVDDDAPNTIMFYANGLSGGRLRVSGITFKGRPNRDTSPTGDIAIRVESCTDFRVDHCSFYDMGSAGVNVGDQEMTYGHSGGDMEYVSQGVVDHCYFYDIYKPQTTALGRGYGYGVSVARAYHYLWTVPNLYPDDPWTMFGRYYKNTFIEDCYFVGSRHATQTTWGGAYVLRNSVIEDLRLHECITTGHPVRTNVLGMLTQEIYNVTVRNTGRYVSDFVGFHVEGGSALIYNNTIENLGNPFSLASCEDAGNVFYPLGNTKEVYIWNNALIDCGNILVGDNTGFGGCPAPTENVDYFLNEPPVEKNYEPYQYPHPLTLED
jgi:hypothetical protein